MDINQLLPLIFGGGGAAIFAFVKWMYDAKRTSKKDITNEYKVLADRGVEKMTEIEKELRMLSDKVRFLEIWIVQNGLKLPYDLPYELPAHEAQKKEEK